MDFFEELWARPEEDASPTHAQLWRGTGRALCTGAIAERLSVEALHDEDADVTCEDCLRIIREAAREEVA